MKILTINTTDFRGGAAQVAHNINEGLKERGHHVSFFVANKTKDNKDVFLVNSRINYGFLSKISKYFFKKDIPSFIVFKTRDIFRSLIANDIEYFRGINILKTKEYKNADIVHFHNLHGNYFNLKLLKEISKEKPVVWTLHDMWALTGHCSYSFSCQKWKDGCGYCPDLNIYPSFLWDNTQTILKKKKRIYEESNLNIVSPSSWLHEKAKEGVLGKQKNILIYNGINTSELKKYNKEEARGELGLPQDKKIVLFLSAGGREDKRKGWFYSNKIIENFPDVHFLCIGGKKEDTKEGNVEYMSYVDDRDKLARYYSAVDVFLFTSLAENFPLVILEAMACGTPILSFDVGGVREAVIHKENGYISKYKDLEDLSNGLKYIFQLTEEEIDTMSRKSRKRIETNFSLEKMIDNYIAVYKKISNE